MPFFYVIKFNEKMQNLIAIGNDGQAISTTNYFDTEHALSGFYYLSWNDGAGRLLIPDSKIDTIAEVNHPGLKARGLEQK